MVSLNQDSSSSNQTDSNILRLLINKVNTTEFYLKDIYRI